MEHLPIISHNSFRAIGFHKSRSPSPPYGPAPQGSQRITMVSITKPPLLQEVWLAPMDGLAVRSNIHHCVQLSGCPAVQLSAQAVVFTTVSSCPIASRASPKEPV